jgi:25S rRNA (cytosine2278-C5)-methyltransferase
LDACAAPGNKTSHLAALAVSAAAAATATTHTTKTQRQTDEENDDKHGNTFPIKVYALDRSKDRCEALKRRMRQLLPDTIDKVQIHAHCRDFLSLGRPSLDDGSDNIKTKGKQSKKPKKSDNNDGDHAMVHGVTDILVDPSCSGSGIFHRSNDLDFERDSQDQMDASLHRLQSLSNFQTTVLRHALTNFENVQRVVYSTCSIHEQENEGVVADVLKEANIAAKWHLVAPSCLRDWQRRGRQTRKSKKDDKKSSSNISCLTKEQLATLIRADRSDETNGFFVACFARKHEDNAASSSSSQVAKEKKKRAKSAHTTSAPSIHGVAPIPNVPFYSGQFKTNANQENKDKPTESSSKNEYQAALKKTDAKTSSSTSRSTASGNKRKSESTAKESSDRSTQTKDQEEEAHQNNQKKKKNTEDKQPPQKESDASTSPASRKRPKTKRNDDPADHTEDPEKPLPKKAAKKLEWKRRQRQSKVQRLHSKQNPKNS